MILDFHEPVSAFTHLLWAIVALPAWYYLVKDRVIKWPLHVFMFTVVLCYLSSFLYHAYDYAFVDIFRFIDNTCIFLLMAGTYTPVVWKYCMTGKVRTLIIVWTSALAGIALRAITGKPHEFIYLAMAWGMIFASYDLLTRLLHKDFFLILLGGFFYTIGAILEYLKLPTIIPHWVEHHEIWHLFVMAGTTCHYIFMYRRFTLGRPKVCNKI